MKTMSKNLKATTIYHFVKLKDTANYRVFQVDKNEKPDFNKLYVPSDHAVAALEEVEVEIREVQ